MWQYAARVDRVVDGDTLSVDVDLGFRVMTRQRLRLLDVDAPETRGVSRDAGAASKAALERLLPVGCAVVVETAKGDRYGRWLARVHTGGVCVNDWLVAEGHAGRWPGAGR